MLAHLKTSSGPLQIKVYWGVWFASIAILLVLRFSWLPHVTDERLNHFVLAYFGSTWIVALIVYGFEHVCLMSYLKIHHNGFWADFRWQFWVCDWSRPFCWHRWLASGDDFGDPALASRKTDLKRMQILLATILLSFVFMVPMVLGEFEVQF